MWLRDVTGRGPSPVVYACTNVVDERTHKIENIYCRPYICSSQSADDDEVNWLDQFEDEPLLGTLFETDRCEGGRDSSEANGTFSTPSGAIVYDCQNVEHANMTSTREPTHEDRCPSLGEKYLPYKTEISNMDSSGSLQTGPCGNVTCRSKGSCKKEQEIHASEQPGCLRNTNIRAVKGQSNDCPEIPKESIRID